MDERDAPLMEAMTSLAGKHPRYGYRRVWALLRRAGFDLSPQRTHRLWRKAGLQVPKKRRRRRVPGAMKKPRPKEPEGKNHVWAWDFVHDSCANGQVLKCLTVVDEFTRESLAIEVAGSIRAADAIKTLGRLIASHGAPAVLRSDNGPEFVAHKLAEWLDEEGIETAFIQPGRPWQNGTNESFNGKFRDECLDAEWFSSRREARAIIEAYRREYNDFRPHSSLGYQTPNEFKKVLQQQERRCVQL